jgi:hypothetical protein
VPSEGLINPILKNSTACLNKDLESLYNRDVQARNGTVAIYELLA